MPGGLMQLSSVGAQDVFITGNPEITFFKAQYRRHTNFAIESMEQTFSGQVEFGRKATCIVARNADLISRCYLQVDIPAVTASAGSTFCWVKNLGNTMIQEINFEIGGQKVDTQYGEWMTLWNELTQSAEKYDGYNDMIGNTVAMTTESGDETPAMTLYVPLQFWFCRNPGMALPLIALQYHEVKFNIQFRPVAELYIGTPSATPSISNASLFIDYIYLDTDERTQFATSAHEYLIEQLQYTGPDGNSSSTGRYKMAFNHPCKELVWVIQPEANVTAKHHIDFTNSTVDPLVDAELLLNGQPRFTRRKAAYFNLVQPYQHHTRIPSTGIYVYSFALNPEEHQPSGTVNMSRIDNATLNYTTSTGSNPTTLRMYAVNYNLLKIVSGMGGVTFAN